MKPVLAIALAALLVGCDQFRVAPDMAFAYTGADGRSVSCNRGNEPSNVQQLEGLIEAIGATVPDPVRVAASDNDSVRELLGDFRIAPRDPLSIAIEVCVRMLAGDDQVVDSGDDSEE